MALGVGLPVAAFVANSLTFQGASAQDSTGAVTRPTGGTENQQRGAGGELKLIQWQAVSTLSPHNATGTKDALGATPVFEPLLNYLPDGSLTPSLVKVVPTLENGGLSADLTTVTYELLEGVVWSDGTPFTAHDVVATYTWLIDPVNAAITLNNYLPLASVEAVDDLTVKLTFKTGTLAWYIPFSGTNSGFVYPKHVLEQGDAGKEILRANPIGTGPYTVTSFTENDQVIYAANELYREPNKPYYATINLKGGGDAASAARAVLETGDWDVAWNPQVEPQIIRQLESANNGKAVFPPGPFIEAVFFNFSDPNQEVDGQRSEKNTPHPFLTDPAVRTGDQSRHRSRHALDPVLLRRSRRAGRRQCADRHSGARIAKHRPSSSISTRRSRRSTRRVGCWMEARDRKMASSSSSPGHHRQLRAPERAGRAQEGLGGDRDRGQPA